MKLKTHNNRTSHQELETCDWDASIELLAMQLCPTKEWQSYEKRMQALARQAAKPGAHAKTRAKVRVFPVWRKYRQQAKRVATLYQALPVFRRLPLALGGLVGNLLFK
jgi:hypothetical protein